MRLRTSDSDEDVARPSVRHRVDPELTGPKESVSRLVGLADRFREWADLQCVPSTFERGKTSSAASGQTL